TYRFGYDDELNHPSAAVQWACSLAAQAGAQVDATIATQHHAVSNPLGARLASGAVARENQTLAEAAERTATELRAAAKATGVAVDVKTFSAPYPDIRDTLTVCARLYDLTVVDAASDQS